MSAIIRIWCGLHQLDLVMQRVFKPALDSIFDGTLTGLIGHLRHHANLIANMRSTCSKITEVRWVSMDSKAAWLVNNHARVQRHLDGKNPACMFEKVWWVFLHALQAFAREAKATFVSLQGLTTIVSQQRATLQRLVDSYCCISGMMGPLELDQIGDIVLVQPAEKSGGLVVTHESVRSGLDGLGLWIMGQLDSLEADDICPLA